MIRMLRRAVAALLAAAATTASAAQQSAGSEVTAEVRRTLDRDDDPVTALVAVQQELRRCGPEPSWTEACFDMPILAANVALRAGHYPQAWDYARQALRLARARRPEVSREMAHAYSNMGFILQAWGDHVSAERYLRRALLIHRHLNRERHGSTASAYDELGMNLDAQRRYGESADLLAIALAIRQDVLGEGNPATATSYNNVADVLARRGDLVRAESAYRHAFAVGARTLPESHRLQVARRLALAVVLQIKDGPFAAYAEYDRAIAAATGQPSAGGTAPGSEGNASIRRIFFFLTVKAGWDAGAVLAARGALAAPGGAAKP